MYQHREIIQSLLNCKNGGIVDTTYEVVEAIPAAIGELDRFERQRFVLLQTIDEIFVPGGRVVLSILTNIMNTLGDSNAAASIFSGHLREDFLRLTTLISMAYFTEYGEGENTRERGNRNIQSADTYAHAPGAFSKLMERAGRHHERIDGQAPLFVQPIHSLGHHIPTLSLLRSNNLLICIDKGGY